jgi:hypothetical protein
MRILKGSINLSKIDKAKIIAGAKGSYLNVSIMVKDELDQYGNIGFISQDTTKEERESGIKGTILGNIKDLPGKSPVAPTPYYSEELSNKIPPPIVNLADDLPF